MLIAADGTARKQPVTLGLHTAYSVQITEGLTTADNVITTGSYALDDGTKARIGPSAPENGADDKKNGKDNIK